MTDSSPALLPIAVVIPSRNRPDLLARTLDSLLHQTHLPTEILVVDASDKDALLENAELLHVAARGSGSALRHLTSLRAGAAPQRNQGVENAGQPFILFLDDDILLTPDCLAKLHGAMQADQRLGGVSAMISNGAYHPPGGFSRRLFHWLNDKDKQEFAGRCLGPGLTTMPSDNPALPEVNQVEWLITGCTLYRRAALPDPPFAPFFHDASIGEDLALSLGVSRQWKLANARTARVEHLGTGRRHNLARECALSEMEIVNRYHIMTQILRRRSFRDHVQFLAVQFALLPSTLLQKEGWKRFPARLWGRVKGLWKIVTG